MVRRKDQYTHRQAIESAERQVGGGDDWHQNWEAHHTAKAWVWLYRPGGRGHRVDE